MTPKVAILGANRFIGTRAVELMHLTSSAVVRPVVRRPDAFAGLSRFDLEAQVADGRDLRALIAAFAGCTHVVHAVAGDPTTIVDVIEPVYHAAAENRVKRLIYLSSASVHGQSPLPDTDETSLLRDDQTIEYNNAKVRAERRLKELSGDGAVDVVILRPGIVFGPRSAWTGGFANELLDGTAYLVGNGSGVCNGVYVDNVVHAILKAIEVHEAAGQVYLICQDEAITWADLCRPIANAFGRDLTSISVSTPASFSPSWGQLLRTNRMLRHLFNRLPRPIRTAVRAGFEDWRKPARSLESRRVAHPTVSEERALLHQCQVRLSSRKAERELGYWPIVAFDEACRRSVGWLTFAGYPTIKRVFSHMIEPFESSVSVVITTYNHARFLADAIDSVLAQTMPPSEIIVIDDGSADNPESVVRAYQGITLIRQANQGLGAARNTGLKAAKSRFVSFLDADDRLGPFAIACNVALFQEHPDCAFVYGAYRYIGETGAVLRSVPFRAVGQDAYAHFLAGNQIGMHATVLYRRDILKDAGGFDTRLRACEDYDVYLRLSESGKVVGTPETLADYRQHGSNMSHNNRLMLSAALSVLRRQKPVAVRDAFRAAAYRSGIDNWKSHYADMQLSQLSTAFRSRSSLISHLANTAAVTAKAPLQMAKRARHRLKRWLSRRGVARAISFGDLERTRPFSTEFGFDRGKPIDRRYVEAHLAQHAGDIRGRVLEIGDSTYTTRFGGSNVETADVLNRYEGHPSTTFVGDLSDSSKLPPDAFDCIILTQTLHLIFDMQSSIATLHRALKVGGVLLVTVPWVSTIDRGEWGESWFWSLTPGALQELLARKFGGENVETRHFGSAYACTAFLYGIAEHRNQDLLEVHDAHCPLIAAARAVKQ